VAAPAACQTTIDDPASTGQGGISLSVGAKDGVDCSAGEGAAAAVQGEGGRAAECDKLPVDYTQQIAPILATCRGEVCHDFSGPNAVRAFIAAPADECCNQRELIAPGHPERSYLVDKLQGQRLCYGQRMPAGREPLSLADIALIQTWICQGAELPR
jgi:hypothetical protein